MRPGAVAIWPVPGGVEVSPIDRLTWGVETLTVVLKNRQRIVVRCRSSLIADLNDNGHDDLHWLRFTNRPRVLSWAT